VDCICNVKDERVDILVLAWLADYPDRHNFLHNLFHSEAPNNYVDYGNPKLDSSLDPAALNPTMPFGLAYTAKRSGTQSMKLLASPYGLAPTMSR
jgi:ABC-type oligopeptide transport system substrate-binding subunit